MPLRNLPLQILSLVVLVFAVFFAYQASIRWSGFSAAIKEDWRDKFRADTAAIEPGVGVRSEKDMMGKTPVYLYVGLLESAKFWLVIDELTRVHSVSHGGVSWLA